MTPVLDSPAATKLALSEPLRIGSSHDAVDRVARPLQFAVMTLFWAGIAAAGLTLLALAYFAVMFVITDVAPHLAILIGCLLLGEIVRWRAVRG